MAATGAANARYNGGLCLDTGKGDTPRWVICCRDGSLLLYSRAVMAAHIGRLLTSSEIVHHRDENTLNDDVANLQIVTRAEHIAMHRAKLAAARRAQSRCKRGHERTPENTRVYNGCRQCIPCQRITQRAWRQRKAVAR